MSRTFAEYVRRAIATRKKTVAEIVHEQITEEQKANLRSAYRAYLDNKRRTALQERGRNDSKGNN